MKFKVIEGVSGKTGFSFNKKMYSFKECFFETDNKELISYLTNLGKYTFCEPIIERPVGEPIEEKKVKKGVKNDND